MPFRRDYEEAVIDRGWQEDLESKNPAPNSEANRSA
jgi:hypothetical protein